MGRMYGVLNWYKENPSNNPNIYELMEVMCEAARNDELDPETLKELTELEIKRLIDNGIVKSEEDKLVALIREVEERVLGGEVLSDDEELLTKMTAGVAFHIKRSEAETGKTYTYDNSDEYYRILNARKKVIEEKGILSEAMQNNLSFIDSRYALFRKHLPEGFGMQDERRAKMEAEKDVTIKMMEAQLKPFVYPERLQELLKYYKQNSVLMPAELIIMTIIDLSLGEKFDSVLEKIDSQKLADTSRFYVLNCIMRYAKNGPDFWLFEKRKSGQKIDSSDLATVALMNDSNARLDEKYKKQEEEQKPQF